MCWMPKYSLVYERCLNTLKFLRYKLSEYSFFIGCEGKSKVLSYLISLAILKDCLSFLCSMVSHTYAYEKILVWLIIKVSFELC